MSGADNASQQSKASFRPWPDDILPYQEYRRCRPLDQDIINIQIDLKPRLDH